VGIEYGGITMARPTKFNPDRARIIVRVIREGGGRDCATMMAGVGLRTLAEWLAKGRAGDPALVEWVKEFEAAEQTERERRCAWQYEQESVKAKERYQRFKAQRLQWHLDQLGPREFWSRRLHWLLANGKTRTFVATLDKLRAEGFGMNVTP
jgi:hypothetical protein